MIDEQINNYKITKLLGEGGMASVYLAETDGHKVAIKILHPDFAGRSNIRKRFIGEAKTLMHLNHDNIIKAIEIIDAGDLVAFVMEYIEGQTLDNYITQKRLLSDEEISDIYKQMIKALSYIHSKNLIHRDIKPSNFMFAENGLVKLLDFGIAKNTNNHVDYTKTGLNQQMGTPLYMSPEQIKSTSEVTKQTDIYSIGVVLWQMVMGKKPYDTTRMTLPEIQVEIMKNNLPLTYTKWDEIIQSATTKLPENRELKFLLDKSEKPLLSASIRWFKGNRSNLFNYFFIVFGAVLIMLGFIYLVYTNSSVDIPESYLGAETKIENKKISNSELVQIGKQIWTKSNYASTIFNDGNEIIQAQTKEEWEEAAKNHLPAWCYNLSGEKHVQEYGVLYNWYAINDFRGLAPKGFRVASKKDWDELHDFIGKNNSSGLKLIATHDWQFGISSEKNNSTGFTALPAGFRTETHSFSQTGYSAAWWTSSESKENEAIGYAIKDSTLKTNSYYKYQGFSVRLIKE